MLYVLFKVRYISFNYICLGNLSSDAFLNFEQKNRLKGFRTRDLERNSTEVFIRRLCDLAHKVIIEISKS